MNTLYVLSIISNKNDTLKMIVCGDRFLHRAVTLLVTSHMKQVKIAALNLFTNLALREDHQSEEYQKAKKIVIDLNLKETILNEMRIREKDPEVRGYVLRAIRELD